MALIAIMLVGIVIFGQNTKAVVIDYIPEISVSTWFEGIPICDLNANTHIQLTVCYFADLISCNALLQRYIQLQGFMLRVNTNSILANEMFGSGREINEWRLDNFYPVFISAVVGGGASDIMDGGDDVRSPWIENIFAWVAIGITGQLRSRPFNGSGQLLLHDFGLPFYGGQSQPGDDGIYYRDVYDDPFRAEKPWHRFIWGLVFGIGDYILCVCYSGKRWVYDNVRWWDYPIFVAGLICVCMGFGLLLLGHAWPPKQECEYNHRGPNEHKRAIVARNMGDSEDKPNRPV